MSNVSLIAQSNGGGAGGAGVTLFFLVYIAIIVLIIAGAWKMYRKAGQPGWGVLIPIYNAYLWCKICGRPGWWVILLLIPFISIIFAIILCIDLAKSFGRGVGTAVGLILIPVIFVPILGFGSAQYQGPAAA